MKVGWYLLRDIFNSDFEQVKVIFDCNPHVLFDFEVFLEATLAHDL